MPSDAPHASIASGLRDNHSRGNAGDFLRGNITPGSALSFVSAYFTVHAYQAMREELEGAAGLRFLFGEPSFTRSIEKEGKQSRQFQFGDQGLSVANQLSQNKVAKDCAEWISRMVEIKSIVRAGFLHGKMYHKPSTNSKPSTPSASLKEKRDYPKPSP
jgi:hypothetical protein